MFNLSYENLHSYFVGEEKKLKFVNPISSIVSMIF